MCINTCEFSPLANTTPVSVSLVHSFSGLRPFWRHSVCDMCKARIRTTWLLRVGTLVWLRLHVSTQAATGTCRTHLASYSVGVQLSTQAAAGTCLSYEYSYTGSDTGIISELIRAVAPAACVLNQMGWTRLRTLGFQQWEFFCREFRILEPKINFFEKIARA